MIFKSNVGFIEVAEDSVPKFHLSWVKNNEFVEPLFAGLSELHSHVGVGPYLTRIEEQLTFCVHCVFINGKVLLCAA